MVRKTIRDIINWIGVLFTFPYCYLTAALAGGLAVLAFAPFGLYPAMVISIALLLHCLVGATVRQAGWVGWWYGLGLFAPGLQWIFISLDEFGQLPVVISLAILVGLPEKRNGLGNRSDRPRDSSQGGIHKPE